jgi:hypothetical protein
VTRAKFESRIRDHDAADYALGNLPLKSSEGRLLHIVQGFISIRTTILRVHYIADLSCDVDGARVSYRYDNRQPPALDDIHKSAGYAHGSW